MQSQFLYAQIKKKKKIFKNVSKATQTECDNAASAFIMAGIYLYEEDELRKKKAREDIILFQRHSDIKKVVL